MSERRYELEAGIFKAALDHGGEQESAAASGDHSPTEAEPAPEALSPWMQATYSGSPEAPRQIGPYRILEPIGEGGMGTVYVAEQTEPVRRRVAIKLIKLGMASRPILARFDSERQALAMMSHRNIARILDAGAIDASRPYFVMEYVPGITITEYADSRRLTIRERLELFLDVCSAVEHAHQRGIIHRDLKPSNILVTEEDGSPLAKVIDFGIAKATSQRLSELTVHTRFGSLMGTPEYMSPEQAQSSPLDIDTRSDVYSLGAVLYELLVGEPALTFGDDQSAAAVQRTIVEVDVLPPSARLARLPEDHRQRAAHERGLEADQLRRRLRGDLDWIAMKALEKDRSRRYSFASELAKDVRAHLEHRPVAAGPPSVTYRARKFARRHRLAVLAAALLSVSLLIGAWGAWGWWRAARGAALAQRFGEDVGALEWQLRVSQMSPRHDVTGEYRRFGDKLEEIETAMTELGGQARAPGDYALGRGLLALDRVDDALPHLERAWQSGLRTPQLAFARGVALGLKYHEAYDRARAIRAPDLRAEQTERARERYREPALESLAEARSSPTAPLPYVDALISMYEERYEDALRLAGEALDEAPWLWEAFKLQGDVLSRIGRQHYGEGRREEGHATFLAAEEAYRNAIEIAPSAPGAHQGRCERGIYRLFQALNGGDAEGSFEGFRDQAEKACAGLEAVYPEHPDLGIALANIGLMTARHLASEGTDPRPELERTRQLAGRVVERQPDSAAGLRALADSMLSLGRYGWERGEDVRDLLEEAGSTFERAAELEPSLQALNNAANAYLLKSRLEERLGLDPSPSLMEAERLYRRTASYSPDEVTTQANITLVMRDLAKWRWAHGEDPRPALLEAAEIMEQQLAKSPELPFLHTFMAGAATDLVRAEADWRGEDGGLWIERGRRAAERAAELGSKTHSPEWARAQLEAAAAKWMQETGADPTNAARNALEALDAYQTLFPEQARAFRLRAEVRLSLARSLAAAGRSPQQEISAARRAIDEALRLQPSEARLTLPILAQLIDLSMTAEPDEHLAEAVSVADRLEATNPRQAASLLAASRLLLWQHRLSEAVSTRRETARRIEDLLARAVELDRTLEPEATSLLSELETSFEPRATEASG